MQLLTSNRSFRRLLAGQVVSELGNWFNFIAALGLARAVSSAAPEVTAVMLIARLAPFSIFAPIAGALVDRWSRRSVMIVTDLVRALLALGFLLVRGPQDLWIAYLCTALSTLLAAFFEGAKNASLPNVTGDEGLLAGNALMFSSRFLLMTVGAALGGAASASLGYGMAFIVNAASFLVSAWSVWLIPEGDIAGAPRSEQAAKPEPESNWVREVGQGWSYIASNRLVAALIGINILWATGGGAIYMVFDRMGAVLFAAREGMAQDTAVAILYASSGFGLFVGMALATRVGRHVELHGLTARFIGWMLFLQGVVFAGCGLAPNLWSAAGFILLSRAMIGVEYAVQETLLMRTVPDNFRGRVSTTDRAAEILTMSFSTAASGWALRFISIDTLAILSGLFSGFPGILWLILLSRRVIALPATRKNATSAAMDQALVAEEQ
jgi:MFS family permease